MLLLLLTACGTVTEDKPYGHYEDDEMIGTVFSIDFDKEQLEVDISEWVKRDVTGLAITDEGYSYFAEITNRTVIKYEDGTVASLEDIQKGQKVLVHPPSEENYVGEAEEIILLDMTYEEKYRRLLSHHEDRLNVVVMYERGEELPFELQEPLYEEVVSIVDDLDQNPVGAWVEYDENYVVDYKEELDIEQFPAILVFSHKELLFKTYDAEEVHEFFKEKYGN